jgi:hypothetical protein
MGWINYKRMEENGMSIRNENDSNEWNEMKCNK